MISTTGHSHWFTTKGVVRAFMVTLIGLQPFAVISAHSQPSIQPPIRRDSEALAVLRHSVEALSGDFILPSISTLRVTGTITRNSISSVTSATFIYDSLLTERGAEFRNRVLTPAVTKDLVSNHGKANASQSSAVTTPKPYFRYILQPDNVPLVLLAVALRSPNLEVRFDDAFARDNSSHSLFHISIASSSDGAGRTLFLRHWIIDGSTYLPIKSTICLPTASTIVCHSSIESTYTSYRKISGFLSPGIVTVNIGNRETGIHTIQSIELNPQFADTHFSAEASDDVRK